jgi:hypothetical protein
LSNIRYKEHKRSLIRRSEITIGYSKELRNDLTNQ